MRTEEEARDRMWTALKSLGADTSGLDGPQHKALSTLDMACFLAEEVEEMMMSDPLDY
jgi:hypothetical protein